MRLDLYMNAKVNGDKILSSIGLEEDKIPRIRGVGIEDGMILVHTRTGGGNRDQYDSVESYISGDYGLDYMIDEYKKALKDFSDYRWHITVYSQSDFDDYKEFWKVPYEAQYRFPETDKEWRDKEKEIKKSIAELEDQKRLVKATAAYTNEYMTTNKYYIRDEDDDFDSTYANFWFEVPKEFREELLATEDPVMRAAFGDAKDYIRGVIGGDKKAQQRIQKRIDEAVEEARNAET